MDKLIAEQTVKGRLAHVFDLQERVQAGMPFPTSFPADMLPLFEAMQRRKKQEDAEREAWSRACQRRSELKARNAHKYRALCEEIEAVLRKYDAQFTHGDRNIEVYMEVEGETVWYTYDSNTLIY